MSHLSHAMPSHRSRPRAAGRSRWAVLATLALTLPLAAASTVGGASPASAAATCSKNAAVYGADGSELTFSVLDDPAGGGGLSVVNHVKDLGYTPRTLVALDYKTLLATDSSGNLHKLDVVTNSTGGTVRDTVWVSGGWTHDHLAYDGAGHLYGTAGGNLLRYDLSSGFTSIGPRRIVAQGGYVVDTLFANAPNSLIATNADGALINYKMNPAKSTVSRHVLRSSTWRFRNMISPGGGVYYGQTTAGAMNHYTDADPVDGSGTDISYPKAISTRGWTQHLLTAVTNACAASSGDVTYDLLVRMFGSKVGSKARVEAGLPSLRAEMKTGGITNAARKAAFFATLANESTFLYNADQGGSSSGYHGRGFIQLTDDSNYGPAGTYFRIDLLGSPDLALHLDNSARIARWYWTVNRPRTNEKADDHDMAAVNRYIGFADQDGPEADERCLDFKHAYKVLTGTAPTNVTC